ncbi:MAG: YihY/virulence factor BrkB family protein [Thermodesulfobacteriota bacterium]
MRQWKTMGAASLQDRLQAAVRSLGERVWQRENPGEGLIRLYALRLLRLAWILVLESRRDRLPLRASALTFTVILSLVPTLALGTAVLKGLGAGNQMRKAAHLFIDRMEDTGNIFALPGAGGPPSPAGTGGDRGDASLTAHLHSAVETIFDYVDRTDFATLGAFGIAGVVIAVLSVLGNIERSMNAIWHAKANRPLGRKLIDYLALMILLPLSINVTLATEATIKSPALFGTVQTLIPLAWLQSLLLTLLPHLLVIATFTVMYRFLPNTRVRLLPAFAGGLIGGMGWMVVQGFYVSLQIGVARYNAIYGSFATLPLLLFWIYTGWLIFLAGAEVSYVGQVWRNYTPAGHSTLPLTRMSIAFDILAEINDAFSHRRALTCSQLSTALGWRHADIQHSLDELEQAGILRKAACGDEDGEYLPAAPREELRPAEIVGVVLGEHAGARVHPLARDILQAAKETVRNREIQRSPLPGGQEREAPVQAELFSEEKNRPPRAERG